MKANTFIMVKIIISSKGFNGSKTFLVNSGNGQTICSGSIEKISAFVAEEYPDLARAIISHSEFSGKLPESIRLTVEPSEESKISGALRCSIRK